jgi:hypothetical protein
MIRFQEHPVDANLEISSKLARKPYVLLEKEQTRTKKEEKVLVIIANKKVKKKKVIPILVV